MAIPSGIDLSGLNELNRLMKLGAGPIDQMHRLIGRDYLAETQKEYSKKSRGAGKWPALASSSFRSKSGRTKPRPSRQGKPRKFAILIDSGRLIGGLSPRRRGNLFIKINGGIRIGYNNSRHSLGGPTFQTLADWHQNGEGNLPVREIFRVAVSEVDTAHSKSY